MIRRISTDDEGRVPLGDVVAKVHRDYIVREEDDGVIVLTPAAPRPREAVDRAQPVEPLPQAPDRPKTWLNLAEPDHDEPDLR